MQKYLIGICGVARSGKDTLALIIKNELEKATSEQVEILSIASSLKEACREECLAKFGADPTSDKEEDKEKTRPFLVEQGGIKRQETQGRFWIDILDKKIQESKNNFFVISDIRFKEYDFDEVDYIKANGGLLIHIERVMPDGSILPPKNSAEEKNDPVIKQHSDFKIQIENLTNNPDINSIIRSFNKIIDACIVSVLTTLSQKQ